MPGKAFRFNIQELGGALGDLGTLLPLLSALVLINGLNPTAVMVMAGLFYIASGLYYRLPTPVQPLKAVSAIAITLGLSATVISAAGLLMGLILLVLSLTNLINVIVRLFPQAVVRGIQVSIGLILLRKGAELIFSEPAFANQSTVSFSPGQIPIGLLLAGVGILIFLLFKLVFFRQSQRFPASLALLAFGVGAGLFFGQMPVVNGLGPILPDIKLPNASELWLALVVLVIPQLPLTLGNAVVSMNDTARAYFGDQAGRVSPKALTMSMGLANVAAGLVGAIPMCHGSGGLTAHYKLGARTGASNLMVGSILLVLGVAFGSAALSFLSIVPLAILGVLLGIVGFYHVLLVRDVKVGTPLAIAAIVVIVTLVGDNLALGFGAGILLHHVLRLDIAGIGHSLLRKIRRIRQDEKKVELIDIREKIG
ncbi:MAG: sulfate permease [Chloroflexi bacterium]|nr:sulfate permease [Chloroflexota bacterium]